MHEGSLDLVSLSTADQKSCLQDLYQDGREAKVTN